MSRITIITFGELGPSFELLLRIDMFFRFFLLSVVFIWPCTNKCVILSGFAGGVLILITLINFGTGFIVIAIEDELFDVDFEGESSFSEAYTLLLILLDLL